MSCSVKSLISANKIYNGISEIIVITKSDCNKNQQDDDEVKSQ